MSILLYLVLFQTTLYAQYVWSLGLTGTSFTSSYTHKVTASQVSVRSYVNSIGVSARRMNTKYLGLQLELHKIQKPLIVRIAGSSSLYELRRSNTLFEIPVLTHIEFLKGPLKLVLQTGPQLSILSQEKLDVPQDSLARTLINEYLEPDFKPNPIQIGIIMGSGIAYIISKRVHLGITYRYCIGLSNAYQSPKFASFKSRLNGIFVHLHYIIKK